MPTKRQQQVNKIIQQSLSDVFQREGLAFFGNSLVTVTEVRSSPDLSYAKVYLSIYKAESSEELIEDINEKSRQVRGLLGNRIKKHVRKIPELHFALDKTLDEVYKMEEIFNQIKKEEEARKKGKQ